ncbi:MAG TPA: DUF6677 family protein [Candidatus Angelobacter sp.]|nr:DUF6677 family protein [Candidatus Angelobacter sp.]
MAKTEISASEARPREAAVPFNPMIIVAPLVGWLVPGAGHLVQRRWIRGLLLMVSVVLMFSLGLAMNGKVYQPNAGDLLDILGFVGDLGTGGLYLLSRFQEWGSAAIAAAAANYGTIFIVAAGLLNIMCVVDAYHIAQGRKQ